MWPWGHAAAGFFAYLLVEVGTRRRLPRNDDVVAVLVGTQFPDLVDKPLAWTFGVLPTGRTLAHSLLTVAFVVGLFTWIGTRVGRQTYARPFGVGYLTGVLTDVPVAVLSGDFSGSTFLLWPLLPSPVYETEPSFVAHLRTLELDSAILLQVVLSVAAVVVWAAIQRWAVSPDP